MLKGTKRRDVVVVSFKQEAVDRFHQLRPNISVAPGIGGSADYLLGGKSPGPGVVAFQLPITYTLNGSKLDITNADRIAQAHKDGYAWASSAATSAATATSSARSVSRSARSSTRW